MPVYNGEVYLQEAIDSILNQTFEDFEFLIINDGSTDESRNIICSYNDSRIRLVDNEQNLGLISSLNKGLALAQGELIARQDADDVSLPERLASQINVFDQNADCILVSSNIDVISADGSFQQTFERHCPSELVPWYLIFYNHISGHSQVVFKRDVALDLGGYLEQKNYAEDYDLWVRCSRTKGKLFILPESLVKYRIHDNSVSHQKRKDQDDIAKSIVADRVSGLLSQNISAEDASVLSQFWKGAHWHHDFPSASKAKFIHSYLKLLSKAFLLESRKKSDNLTYGDLEKIIGSQFLIWLKSPLTSRHSIFSKIQIAYYALIWNSGEKVIKSWLIWLLRLPFDTSHSIREKIYRINFLGN